MEGDGEGREKDLLHYHGPRDDAPNQDSEDATGEDQHKGLNHVDFDHLCFGESDGAQNTDFFSVLEDVACHRAREGEEAEEHDNRDEDIEHEINNRGPVIDPLAPRFVVPDAESEVFLRGELGKHLGDVDLVLPVVF